MKYAIVETGGKQFRAVEGGTIEVDRLPVESGTRVKLEQVLLLADGETIIVGKPLIKDLPVWTTVLEHFKGPKVNTFNYSPKKRIRVKIGHRQNYTRLFVEQIGGSEFVKKEPAKVEKAVEVRAEEIATIAKAEKEEEQMKTELKSKKTSPKKVSFSPSKKSTAKAATKTSARKTTVSKAAPKSSPKGKKSVKRTTSSKGASSAKKSSSTKSKTAPRKSTGK
ncbi:MAG: 50S ribosomal protein L21 [Anaerolineales bacterium]|jgi:large subunit ribosomal protein L21